MGGVSSKQTPTPNPYAGRSKNQEKQKNSSKVVMTPAMLEETMEKQIGVKESTNLSAQIASLGDDEFYDGIPQYWRSLSQRSKSLRVTKVSEVSGLLRRAGSVGLGRAVAVFDTIGSSVTNLNVSGGFVSGPTNKNNELSILAFEMLQRSYSKKQLREVAESVMLQMMTLVQLTAELYQELHALDRIEQDYQRKLLDLRSSSAPKGDRMYSLNILATELKNQRKLVKNLKKKSLWSRSMEELQKVKHQKKDPRAVSRSWGLLGSLHYANIILLIDSIRLTLFTTFGLQQRVPHEKVSLGIVVTDDYVARSSSMPPNSRDALYQSLPPNIEASLRSKLQSFHLEKEVFFWFFVL
ncbi:hypothetical protein DH2020_037830 [Rehmannia glutinosa]|uniref:DUF668 domain-containing protein n=1 Tax=Rehmannia glutinosa TaxID=99300 RepID=A0ABR0V2T5_REHGL